MNHDIFLNKIDENNITTIEFINNFGDKIGQLVYEITGNKAIIYNTFIYPEYRRKGILKTYLPVILSMIKDNRISIINLSVLSEDAKSVWERLGFKEKSINNYYYETNKS